MNDGLGRFASVSWAQESSCTALIITRGAMGWGASAVGIFTVQATDTGFEKTKNESVVLPRTLDRAAPKLFGLVRLTQIERNGHVASLICLQ